MNLWDEILARIETKVNRHSFYTWFRPTTFVSEDRSLLTVKVPNTLFKDWLTKHYAGVISEATVELKRPNLVVNFMSDTVTDGPVIPLSPEETAALETVPPAPPPPPPPGHPPAPPVSTPATPSTRSSSGLPTSSRTPPAGRWRKRRRA